MWEQGFGGDQRSVSEIYGTVLIISLAFLTALLLVGAGWVIVDQLTTESQDSLAQDSMQSVDQGIDQITGESVNETTTFEFPEDTGTDVSAEADDGVFNITISTANETFWNRTVAENRSLPRNGSREITLGTIRHEGQEGELTAYQGGGLWRQPQPGGATFILSEPNVDFTGDSLDLGVVNLTNLGAITEGAQVRATQNAQAETAEKLQAFMAKYWTDRYNPAVTAPVEINITIESQYADGWAKYAEERMTEAPKEVIYPFNGDDETVRIVFGKIGDGLDAPPNPTFPPEVLYAGAADWAYDRYNPSAWPPGAAAHGEISGNATHFNVSNPPTDNQYELALYNESGQWLIYNTTDATDGDWVDSDGNVVDPSHTDAIAEVEDTGPAETEYHIRPPSHDDVDMPAVPICVVVDPSAHLDITNYLDEEGEDCLANMVQVDEDLIDPINTSPEWNVTIENVDGPGVTPGATLPAEMYVGETMTVTVNLSNEGNGPGQIPLGLYTLNESNWVGSGTVASPDPYFNRSYLANGSQSADNELDPGESVEREYVVTAQRFMADDDWVVFATTGTDTDWVTDGGSYDTVRVKERQSEFAIEGSDRIALNDTNPMEGDYVEVTVTVNETEGELDDPETQVVRLETDDRIINQTDITLDADEKKDVTMGWTVRDGTAPDVTLTASTYDDTQPKTVPVDGAAVPEPEFEVTITDVDDPVVAGEKLDVNATVENVGNATGDVYVELSNFDGELVDVIELTGLDGGDTVDVTLTWPTAVGDNGTGTLTATAGEDSDTATAEITAPGATDSQFDVTVTGTNSAVTAGATLSVNATVTNTGSEADTQFVYLTTLDGDQADFTELSLDPGDSANVRLTWDTTPADNGTGPVTVASDDDDDSADVAVESPSGTDSEFEVAFGSDSYGVTAGDSLSVNVTVSNVGSAQDTEFVYLEDHNGSVVDTVEVGPLSAGDSTAVTFTWDTSVGEAGNYTLRAASSDDTDTADVAVFPSSTDESNFEVTIEGTNSPVTESEDLTVTATVENTGDSSDTQFVVLENFGGGPVDVTEISLGSGESTTATFTWSTIVGDAGSGDVTVVSADDSDSAPATIDPKETEQRPPLDVVFVMDESGSMGQDACDTCGRSKAEAAVEAAQNAVGSLNASKDRAGVAFFDTSGDEQEINGDLLSSDMEQVNNTIDDLNPGGGTLSGEGLDKAEEILGESNDPSREKVVVLLSDGANNGCKYNETALLNEDPRDCGGSNDDSLDRTQDLADDNATVYSVGYGNSDPSEGDVEIDPAFLQETADIGGGEYYNASNDEQLANAFDEIFEEITEPDTPTFEVTIVGTNDPVESGAVLEVDVEVENTGAAAGQGIVSLADFDDTNVDSVTTSNLSVGESETLTLKWDTTGQAAATDDVTVRTVDDTDTEDVTVDAPTGDVSEFKVLVNDVDEPVAEGETLTVNATVRNDGAGDTQDVVLWDFGKNEVVDTVELSLANSEQTTVTLEWDTEIGDAGNGQVTVASTDDNATAAAEIVPNDGDDSSFAVDIDEGASTLNVTEGETVSLDVAVENTGNETSTKQVYLLDFAGDGILDAAELTLGPGESTTVILEWDTVVGDAPVAETITVESPDDSDGAPVAVGELDGVDSQFEVDINTTASDDGTTAGNGLSVTAEVTNTGADTDEQNVVLWEFGNNSVADIRSVSLGPGESTTVTLEWDTDEDDVGTGEVTVESDDDAATMNAEVLEPTDTGTDLEIVDIDPDSATAGDTLDAEVEIRNNGSADAVGEWVSMALADPDSNATIDGEFTQVDIPAGDTTTVDMSVDTTESTVGDYNLTVETNDDEQTEVVTITEPTTVFDISIVNTNDPVDAGDKLEVDVEVTNTNSGTGTDEATVVLNDTRSGTTVDMVFDVAVERGESEIVTLTWDTAFGDGDENPVEIWAEIANTDRHDDEDVRINEAQTDLDGPSMAEPENPLNIDLEEIEIDA